MFLQSIYLSKMDKVHFRPPSLIPNLGKAIIIKALLYIRYNDPHQAPMAEWLRHLTPN